MRDPRRSRLAGPNRCDQPQRAAEPAGHVLGGAKRELRLRSAVVTDADDPEPGMLAAGISAWRDDDRTRGPVQKPLTDGPGIDPSQRSSVSRTDDDQVDLLALGQLVEPPRRRHVPELFAHEP